MPIALATVTMSGTTACCSEAPRTTAPGARTRPAPRRRCTGPRAGAPARRPSPGSRLAAASPGVAVVRLADERSGRATGFREPLDLRGRVACVLRGVRASVLPAIAVGSVDDVRPGWPGGQRVGVVCHRGRHGVGGVGPAVVGLSDRDDVGPAGRGHGEPEGEVVGLGAGVDQEHRVERRGQGRGELLGEGDDRLVNETRVRVEPQHLVGDCVGQLQVPVPQHGDIVDHVQVAAARGGDQVLAPAALRSAAGTRSSAPVPSRSSRRGGAAGLHRPCGTPTGRGPTAARWGRRRRTATTRTPPARRTRGRPARHRRRRGGDAR